MPWGQLEKHAPCSKEPVCCNEYQAQPKIIIILKKSISFTVIKQLLAPLFALCNLAASASPQRQGSGPLWACPGHVTILTGQSVCSTVF